MQAFQYIRYSAEFELNIWYSSFN